MYSNLILTFSRFEFYIKSCCKTAHKNGNYDEDKYKKNSVVSRKVFSSVD